MTAPSIAAVPTALPDADYARVLRRGLALLVLGFGGFVAWAALAPLDEAVPAEGTVVVESHRKRVDHLTGGLIEQILVREGQSVAAGDTLLVLNEAQSRSALQATRAQRFAAMALRDRLESERAGLPAPSFTDELTAAAATDPDAAAALRVQQDVFASRRKALDGELGILAESVRGLEQQLASLTRLRDERQKQVALFEQQLASYRDLQAAGYVSRNHVLELERQLAEVTSRQSEDLSNIAGVNARLAEFRMRAAQRRIEVRREVELQLADVQRDLATLGERLAGQRDTFERLAVRAPVAGKVVGLAYHTVGGVVRPGERILDLVPEDDTLEVEARVAPQYVDRLHAGLPVDVRLDAFGSHAQPPVLRGALDVVSADTVVDERSGARWYALRVSVPPDELRRLGDLRLQPGMPTTVMVRTGERTLMNYLLRPLLRRVGGALGER
jgi:protease secretion system membrane fusion protein